LRSLAFYLPQFHPVPENDAWWGRGFTEWTTVSRARPLLRGHHQPHLPADLGFYDLRLPESRAAQADLAGRYGIDGFCYYHYWFEGRRLLERPFDEVLRSGDPDFPFCLCWANESWTRRWDGGDDQVLLRQTYSAADDLEHIRWLAEAFTDPRYVRVQGRPLLLVYRVNDLPDPQRTADAWRRESVRLGAGDPYLCIVHNFDADRVDPRSLGFDAAVTFAPDWRRLGPPVRATPGWRALRKAVNRRSVYRAHRLHDYRSVAEQALASSRATYTTYPCVCPGFDNTPRRPGGGATVLLDSSPSLYEWWVREVCSSMTPGGAEEDLLFVNAWNEWGEGNHLEPCQRWGRRYLEAHERATTRWRETVAAGSASLAPS
jgi:lipopolysaccharide biosynthesis protein